MEDTCKIIDYSNVFLSCFSANASKYTPMIREHGMVYILSGKLEINENGKITCLHKGNCAFIRKDNRVNMTKLPKGKEQYKSIWLTFTRKFLREFYRTLNKKQLPEDAERQKVSVYKHSPIPPTDELLKLKMTEGVLILLNTDKNVYASLFDFAEPWKIDILEFLNENYMYDLSMEEIASYTGRSLAVFKRDFAKISDLPPQKWVIQKRLKEARRKIGNGKKVSEVCFEEGFKSLSHFSTAFKRRYGIPPTAK